MCSLCMAVVDWRVVIFSSRSWTIRSSRSRAWVRSLIVVLASSLRRGPEPVVVTLEKAVPGRVVMVNYGSVIVYCTLSSMTVNVDESYVMVNLLCI